MNKMKRRFSLNEKQLGYAMVLPSLILIAVIILWPIASSFYNSLFDYRLNDPAHSQKMLSTTIDLERYADNYYYLDRSLSEVEPYSPDVQEDLTEIHGKVTAQHDNLLSDTEVSEKYDQVNEIIASYRPVTDDDLKYIKIKDEFATEYKQLLGNAQEELNEITATLDGEAAEEILSISSQLDTLDQSILESNFVGLANYWKYLQDSRMWKSLSNTLIFTIVSVGVELIIGLMVALLINRSFKGRGLIRASILVPWAIPTAVSAMMWSYLYDGQSGIVAHFFEQIGLISDSSVLLSTAGGAMFSVILADIWKTMPYMALLILAGLQTIPDSMYEAAQVDGANKWQQFWKITLPMIKGSILVALLFRTLDAFRVFDLIYVLTGGGPANGTESISIYAYKTLFSQQNFGEGSVLSVMVFIFVAIISIIFIKFIGSDLFAGRVKK
ncbi:sugar ABC transporter permease [Oceanobacillus halophilus]|uniref:Sugar ABC transporter permease n=2 Tax=Oceanobacillus halophilus TaxID=930130 RepID=A0A494ZZT5_9BACI|nr:sugar ABC transporter permease [Oceanobacillus halophilus]